MARIAAARLLALSTLAATLSLAALPTQASHAWGNYHWARTANPFNLMLGDNLSTAAWKNALSVASSDWTQSTVLNTVVVAGTLNPRTCKGTAGRGEVCNASYGYTGWLGIAQIWASGSHITKGVVKLNDSYFNTASYNTPAWRALVTCQEVGHIFGLGHQDENFGNTNLNTCMDYTNSPDSNQHPNRHDYDMLEQIYSHLDSTTTVAASLPGSSAAEAGRSYDSEASWGRLLHSSRGGTLETFERDLGNGQRLITHVFWAPDDSARAHRQQARD